MSILKYLSGALPRKTIFNNFFKEKLDFELEKKFKGVCLLHHWLFEEKKIYKHLHSQYFTNT